MIFFIPIYISFLLSLFNAQNNLIYNKIQSRAGLLRKLHFLKKRWEVSIFLSFFIFTRVVFFNLPEVSLTVTAQFKIGH